MSSRPTFAALVLSLAVTLASGAGAADRPQDEKPEKPDPAKAFAGLALRERVAVGSAWLRRDDQGKVIALSAQCPHLGCSIGYDGDGKRFRCPCHKSAFKPSGERESGPSRRGLDPLPVEY